MRIIIAVAIAVIIYVLQNMLYSRLWDRALKVDIYFSRPYVECGERAKLLEVISNEKRLPLPALHVKFSAPRSFVFDDAVNASVTDLYYRNDIFSVMACQKITRTLEFKTEKRGYYKIESINLTAKNLFMTGTFAKTMHPMAAFYVFPKKHNDVKFNVLMKDIMGDIETRFYIAEDPYTFRGIREYSSQDTMSRINWKASAKMGSLMVNMYNQTSCCKVKIMLNLDTNIMIKADYIKELSIELASSAAKLLIDKAMPVMLITNGTDVSGQVLDVYSEGASESHLNTIDKQLACISGNLDVEHFIELVDDELKKKEDNTAYIIISSYYKRNLMERLDKMNVGGMNVNMIVPYYDMYMPEVSRSYMYGWEVTLNDT
ncbi:MAG: DUF58 domain-containing protein [Clostridium sp.]|nr:DUF58 domain-containing protein [Clostridium sp.]